MPEDFRNMSLECGIVLAVLYRSRGKAQWLSDFARANGFNNVSLGQTIDRCEARGYVRSWWGKSDCGGSPRKYFALTDGGVPALREAVRRFGVRLGDLEGLPVVESSGSEDDVARELGILLGLVRDRSGLSSAAVAALAGHKQAWWAKHETGRVRQPDVRKLQTIMSALHAPDDMVARVVELAGTLNRLHFARLGR